ncbi:MAG: iron-sulfur cluster assembly accessory protein [Alphaproteobacteria bacterium]|jgi:iron-sulfur cluster assembly protein|nr:iron-sulfur cluster assembly accessory protein [Alphaproteobacteria bacterium]
MVSLTEGATREIRRLVEHADGQVSGLRIVVRAGTCSGADYLLSLESGPPGADGVFALDNLKILVDHDLQSLHPETRIDYVECRRGAGFLFDNPSAPDTCTGVCEREGAVPA